MMCQLFDLVWAAPRSHLGQALGIVLFHRLDNAAMQRAAPLVQQAPVGHFVRQGMLEGLFQLWEEVRLIEKLRCLQMGKPYTEHGLG